MPAFVALALAVLVLLVLVMPQVDLQAGVLRDFSGPLLLLAFLMLATTVPVFLSSNLPHFFPEWAGDTAPPLRSKSPKSSLLRC